MSGSNRKLTRKTMVLALFTMMLMTMIGQLGNSVNGTGKVAASSMSRSFQENSSQSQDNSSQNQDNGSQDQNDVLAEVLELSNRSKALSQQGRYSEAIPFAERALAIVEKAFGPEHPDVATCCNNLGLLYFNKGDYQTAEPLYKRALMIDEKALGVDNPDVAIDCNNLGNLYYAKDDYQSAEPLYKRALAIYEKALGPEHPLIATCCNNLGSLYQAKGDYQGAEPLLKRALVIREKALGPDDADVATDCNNLGLLYKEKGDYQSAEPLLKRALAIYEKALGPEHPLVATSLSSLGSLYKAKGDYQTAEPLLKRALAINEKALGADNPDVATDCNNLGLLYKEKGDYQSAEPLLKRALAIYEKALGLNHPLVATCCNNLGLLYYNKGDYQSAEPLLKRALVIDEKALGADHPDVASDCNNLGLLYKIKGDYQTAEPLLKRALTIDEKALGPEHPDVAASLSSLGSLYKAKEDYQSAEPIYKRALAIYEKALGADHPDVAISCNNLGSLYYAKGDYQSAEPLYKRALAIYEKALGPDHPLVATGCNNLGLLYQASGDIKQAISYNMRGNEIREREFENNLGSGSEKQKLLYIDQTADEQSITISLNLQTAPTQLPAAESALTVILRRKGRALDAMTNAIANLRARAGKDDINLLDQLASARAALSTANLKGPGKAGVDNYRTELKTLEQQVGELEDKVSARSREFKVTNTEITLMAVQKAIPDNALLIEFAAYEPYNTKANHYDNAHYAVYIFDNKGALKWADLGDAAIIDKACAEFREVLIKQHDKPLSNIETELKPKARALDKLLMQPVRQLLGNSKRLLISPDSNLNLIPFDALVDEQGKYLVETYEISYLTSGRDLLRLQNGIPSEQKPIVMADPSYGDIKGPGTKMGNFVVSGARLSNTIDEANQIKQTLRLQPEEILLQDRASKAALKQLHRPEILHIATHGFFLKEQTGSAESRRTKIVSAASSTESDKNITDADVQEFKLNNPLLKSGLLFAGVNDGIGDDGVLTALEATGLDLWGTKLVVLSACDTGVGEIKNGDGVYGLRRALVLAGSESQLMSLWPVSDAGTRDLMINYYQALKNNEGRSAGLRRVRLELLKDAKRAHPYYWASFIQSGEWANLAGKR